MYGGGVGVQGYAAGKRTAGDTVVAVFTYGVVGAPAVEWVLRVLEEVYSRGGGPGYVELHVYSSTALLREHVEVEGRRVGVVVSAEYPVSHEAWTGIPRIHVALAGGIYSLTKPEAEALIAHEAVHSILHGSPEYYTVPATGSLLAAYIAATVLKDLEVHLEMAARRLHRHLYGLQAYWLREYMGELPCTTLEDVFNTLKASTVWIALNQQPPLSRECTAKLRKPLSQLQEIAAKQAEQRPWLSLKQYTNTITEALNTLQP